MDGAFSATNHLFEFNIYIAQQVGTYTLIGKDLNNDVPIQEQLLLFEGRLEKLTLAKPPRLKRLWR